MPEIETASFFVVGGTLRRDAPSYISRAADQNLYTFLQAGEFCYVLTARQMGKSSLMVRTAIRLRDNGTRVAVLDLTSLGQNLTTEQWYNGLLERVGQQFGREDELEEAWLRFPQLGPMRRFMRAITDSVLPDLNDRAVVFVDEIDAVRSLPFSTDEFFAGIRECYNRRSVDPQFERLTFCLLGVATPSDLIRDTRTTPFNIGRRIELSDFTEQEATPLIQGLCADDAVGMAILQRIVYWTGGHPYLTQRLCRAVANDGKIHDTAGVDRLCKELFLSNRARERDDNLLFVRERMLRSETDTAALLTLYEKIRDGKTVRDDETNPLISVLRLSGIARVENGLLKARNRIYNKVFDDDWVNANMPGAEIRRQRAAYRRGLKRALVITLPLLLIGILIAYRNLYLAKNTIAERTFESPKPPAFWASSRISTAGEQSPIGGILLRTGQPDVTVLVDNFQFGRTSSTGDLRIPLPPASYNIRLEKAGFRPIATSVLVAKNSETPIMLKLEREAAPQLAVTAVPGATVRLDGKELGVIKPDGTFAHEASPGTHAIEIEKTGYLTERGKIELVLGSTTSVNLTLHADPSAAETADAADYAAIADSTDPIALRQYLQKYPTSKNAAQVRNRIEEIDWKIANRTDLQSLDAFLQAHPQGQHANEARGLVEELQRDQGDFIAAEKAGSGEALQAYLKRHPNSPYSEQVRQKLSQLLDREAVLSVIHRYEESYNRQDLNGIVNLWPSCPDRIKKNLQASFHSGEKQKLQLEVQGDPDIKGNFAIVRSQDTRSGSLTSTASVTITLVRQSGGWVIQSGIF
jgi:AAA domain-containing protein/PEGA domain-containing protein